VQSTFCQASCGNRAGACQRGGWSLGGQGSAS
jgi:hypothetical protein